MRKHKLCAGIVPVAIWCPRIVMPYTNIKTSIMIVKKVALKKKYDIFMAISENCGHDARGNTVPGCDFEDIVTSYKKWIIKK
mgnify:CR=1 FL=1